jgi:division/cell wall cluster transcriptional repressor MraZ
MRIRSTVDAKGRVVIPSRQRQMFSGSLVVTQSFEEGYLSCYREENFEMIKAQILDMDMADPDKRKLRFSVVGDATYVKPDSQGRISIGTELWSVIGVVPGDDVYLTDLIETLEICQADRFDNELVELTRASNIDLSKTGLKLKG